MDFNTLMNIASAKQQSKDKIKINRYNSNLPPPKKEVKKENVQSDVVKRLIQEKENEKQLKEKLRRDREKAKQLEEKKKATFRIPKHPKVESSAVDTEKLINSLFEDDEEDTILENGHNTSTDGSAVETRLKSESDSKKESSNHCDIKASDNKHSTSKSSSLSSSSRHKSSSSSSRHKSSSSSSRHKSSSSSSKEHEKSSTDKHKSSSLSGDKKSHSSSSHSKPSSSSHSKSSSTSSTSRSKSSSSNSHSSSSSSSSKHHSGSSSKSSSLKSDSTSSKTDSTSSKTDSTSSDLQQTKSSAEQPITLSKHHLKPVAERHVDTEQLSEKEKILAKLQAIKARTLAAIHQEERGKRKRSKGDGTHRPSKGGEVKDDERVKSIEIIKDNYSSDEETNGDAAMPSVIDIMLTEHQSKLERDKITRMAKQAWERATKKDIGDSSAKRDRKSRHKFNSSRIRSSKDISNHKRKQRDHSLSPEPDEIGRKKVKSNEERKKPKIIKHAGSAAPPPLDFKAILAMAEKKVQEPTKPLSAIPKKKKKEEEERPLTQEEKERKKRVKTKEYQNWLKFGGKHPNKGKDHSSSGSEEEDKKVMKSHKEKDQMSMQPKKEIRTSGQMKETLVAKHSSNRDKESKKSSLSVNKSKPITVNENVLVCGPAEDEDSDDEMNGRPDNPFDRIYKSVHKKSKPNAVKGNRMDDDSEDEEEDSDLDGFIDSGDEEEGNYSKHIAKIFGYNKNRYVDDDEDDLSNMEANFATVMAEEKRSAKLGLMEDLEDMKREEEELKMKALMKKKMRR